MNDGLIPRRYAKALYKFALENGNDAKLYTLMGNIVREFEAQPELGKVMANPFIPSDQKEKLVVTAAGAPKEHPVLSRMVALLQENHRLDMTADIARAYLTIYRDAKNIHSVTVTSAAPLDEATEKRIASVVTKHLGGGSMEYSSRVDPQLIGGFTVNIDNNKLDASVANELKQMRLKLLSK